MCVHTPRAGAPGGGSLEARGPDRASLAGYHIILITIAFSIYYSKA